MSTTTTIDVSNGASINLSEIVAPFFEQMGLTVHNLSATSLYDEYSGVNTFNISSDSLSFGSFQIVPNLNIIAVFDTTGNLISVSGLEDVVANSYGMVTEQTLTDNIEIMYQNLVIDTGTSVTDIMNIVDVISATIQPILDNINALEGYSVVSGAGNNAELLTYNVVINGPNTTQLNIDFGTNDTEYYANAVGSLNMPVGMLIPLIDSTGFSNINASMSFSVANGLSATGYALTPKAQSSRLILTPHYTQAPPL